MISVIIWLYAIGAIITGAIMLIALWSDGAEKIVEFIQEEEGVSLKTWHIDWLAFVIVLFWPFTWVLVFRILRRGVDNT